MTLRRSNLVALLVAGLSTAAVAGPFVRPGPPLVVVPGFVSPFGIPSECWYEQHYFDSLRTGPIEYCRKSLRFRPGALDCLTYLDRVCTVLLPNGQWDQTHSFDEGQLIRCPDGPEPPTCPRLGPPRTLGPSGWR